MKKDLEAVPRPEGGGGRDLTFLDGNCLTVKSFSLSRKEEGGRKKSIYPS